MRGHSLILVATVVAWSVATPALAEDDAAWEAYFGSMDEGEAAAALDTLERDRAEAEAAEVAAREEEARLKKEERRRARAERKAKRDRKKSAAMDEKAEETAEVAAGATAAEPAADEADAITESAGDELAAEGAFALEAALPLLTASSVASLESEPLRLFDSADSGERSFPWGRWLAINLALALLLGGAVYGAKKGKLAHWLKRARLPRAAQVAPELSVSATHNLAHGQAIHLIEGGDFRLVVGSWPGGMTRLATLPAIDGAVAQAIPEELAPALPAGAGMTADDEVEEAPVAAAAIDEVELAAEGVGVKVDI
ncbi:MAG: flagellar biosynthetic protein FliO, partial [Myxococcota bacterium]|nr:flagellar biosynthetic protein FliO [Myxococcota bacterium]